MAPNKDALLCSQKNRLRYTSCISRVSLLLTRTSESYQVLAHEDEVERKVVYKGRMSPGIVSCRRNECRGLGRWRWSINGNFWLSGNCVPGITTTLMARICHPI